MGIIINLDDSPFAAGLLEEKFREHTILRSPDYISFRDLILEHRDSVCWFIDENLTTEPDK